MNITQTLNDGLKRGFDIIVPAETIAEKMTQRLHDIARTAKLPGFRPGKAPLEMLKKKYKASIMPEVLDDVANEGTKAALDKNNLRPALRPKIEIKKFKDGESLEFSIELEVLPEITPMDFSKLTLEKPVAKPDDAALKDALGKLAQNMRSAEPVTTPRPAAMGDVTVIDFEGTVDGVARDGMAGKNHNLELGSNRFIPGFEEKMVGMNVGDVRTIQVTFPAEYHAADLAGKAAEFKVTLHELRELKTPEADDAFAQRFGLKDVAELNEKLSETIAAEYERASQYKLKRSLLDELAKHHSFEVPASMLEQEFNQIWSQLQDEIRRVGKSAEDAKKTDDQLKAEYRDIAARRVRLGLLLAEVGTKNNIQVSEQELFQALQEEASRYPGRAKEVFDFYRKNPQAVDMLRAPIYEQKVADFIVTQAKISEKTVPAAELLGGLSDDDAPLSGHANHGHVHDENCNHDHD